MDARTEHLMAAMTQEIDQLRARVAELEVIERRLEDAARNEPDETCGSFGLGEAARRFLGEA